MWTVAHLKSCDWHDENADEQISDSYMQLEVAIRSSPSLTCTDNSDNGGVHKNDDQTEEDHHGQVAIDCDLKYSI